MKRGSCAGSDWWRKRSNAIGLVKVGEEPSRFDEIIDFSPSIKLGDEDIQRKN